MATNITTRRQLACKIVDLRPKRREAFNAAIANESPQFLNSMDDDQLNDWKERQEAPAVNAIIVEVEREVDILRDLRHVSLHP